MPSRDPLFLHEELMLLALRDEEGTIASGTMYSFALGGAIVAELLLHERIGVEPDDKKKRVNVLDPAPIGEPLLDECLERIRSAKRRASLQDWVSRFAYLKNIRHRVAEQLCRLGILRADEDKILLIFTRKIYPEVDPEPEQELLARLEEAIFTDSEEIEARTVVALSLAHSAGLLKVAFDKKRLKARKERIKRLVNGEITGKATQEAIQAMQAAAAVAVLMPAMIAATTVSAGH